MKSRQTLLKDFKDQIIDKFADEESISCDQFTILQDIIYKVYNEMSHSDDVKTNYLQNSYNMGYRDAIIIFTGCLKSNVIGTENQDSIKRIADDLTETKPLDIYDELEVRRFIAYGD